MLQVRLLPVEVLQRTLEQLLLVVALQQILGQHPLGPRAQVLVVLQVQVQSVLRPHQLFPALLRLLVLGVRRPALVAQAPLAQRPLVFLGQQLLAFPHGRMPP